MNFLGQFERYRLTDRQTRPKLYTTPLRGCSKIVELKLDYILLPLFCYLVLVV